MKKIKTIANIFLFIMIFDARAFEWPVKNFENANLKQTFAQNRKQHFNTSQIFPSAQEVVATDKGKITMLIVEHQNDGNWFESTLGNCIIITHEDNLISIYGNLDKESIEKNSNKAIVSSGTSLGKTKNSAWNNEENSLEFQIADTDGKTFLNPLILMPRISTKETPSLDGISLENKLGRSYELSSTRSIQSGMYKVYKNRRENHTSYTSSIYINGLELEKINKDTLEQKDGLLSISEQRQYTSVDFYPDESRELLGQIVLPHGNNTVTITVKDIFENEKTLTFNIQGY